MGERKATADAASVALAAAEPVAPTLSETLWKIVPRVYLSSLLCSVALSITVPITPLFARELAYTDGQVGMIVAAESIGRLASDYIVGNLLVKYGARQVITKGLLGTCLAGFLCMMAPSWYLLFAAQLLLGFSEGFFYVGRQTYLRGACPANHRGRATSIVPGLDQTAFIIGPSIGGYLSQTYGIRTPYWAAVILPGLAALSVLWYMEETHQKPSDDAEAKPTPLQVMVQNREILLTSFGPMLILAILRSSRMMAIPLQGDDLGLSHVQIGQAVSLGFLFGLILFLPVGYAADTYGRKTCATPAYFILSMTTAMFPFAFSFTSLSLIAAASGFGNGLSTGLVVVVGADLAPTGQEAGAFLAVWALLYDGSLAVGPLLAGFLIQVASLKTACYLIGIIGFGGAMWFAFVFPETLKKKPPPPPSTG
eukprot:m.97452 g.97452  ORF g.97452 m.97452 type:complete len:424 (-) comp51359_c0_seq1:111-1382(-)